MTAKEANNITTSSVQRLFSKALLEVNASIDAAAKSGKFSVDIPEGSIPETVRLHLKKSGYSVDHVQVDRSEYVYRISWYTV